MKYSNGSDYGLEDLLQNTHEVSGCHLWKGRVYQGKYGHILFHGKVKLVHRLAYEFVNGPLPPRYRVLHICPHRTCCNPNHIITDSISMVDLVRKPGLSTATWSKPKRKAFKNFIPGKQQFLWEVFQNLIPNDEDP